MARKFLKLSDKTVCSGCLAYSQRFFVNQNPEPELQPVEANMPDADEANVQAVDDPVNDNVVDFATEVANLAAKISSVSWDILSDEEKSGLCNLSHVLGGLVKDVIYNDGRDNILLKYANYDYLSSVKKVDWINERNGVLCSFVQGATGVNPVNGTKRKVNCLASVIEQIHHLRDPNLVTPFASRQNVFIYSVTGSRLATKIMGQRKDQLVILQFTTSLQLREILCNALQVSMCITQSTTIRRLDDTVGVLVKDRRSP